MADGSIIIDTKIDTKNVGSQLAGLKKNIQEGVAATAKAATTIMAGLTAAIGAVGAASINFSKTADRVDKMSQSLGLSRQGFQELDYVMSQNGISIDSLGMGIKTLQQSINSASKDSTDMSNALNKLGISVKDANGDFLDQEVILKQALTALQSLEPGLEKSLMAEQLFGRSAQDLMPLLNQQAGSIDELTARAQQLGLVMGDDAVNAGVAFGDLLADLKGQFGALLNDAIAPIIPQINILIKDFIAWATEGDRLKNMISGVANFIVKAFQSGIIPALAGGALTVKVLSVAMGVLNAVMAANPVSLIILGIGALIAAIIVLYKNWDKVVYFFQITFAKIGAAVAILGSKIKEGFIVAFNASKIAALSLAQIIFDKVLGAVQAMLGTMSKLPLVGEQFAKVNTFVGGLRDGLNEAADAAKQESAEAIAAAKEAQDASEERYRSTQAAAEAAAKARLDEIEANKRAAEEEKAAAEKRAADEEAARYRVAGAIEEVSDKEKELADARKRYAEDVAILEAKKADGVITEQQLNEELLNQAKRYQDQLYQLGYTAQQSGTAGADAMKEVLWTIGRLNQTMKNADIAKTAAEAGENTSKSFAQSLKESAHLAIAAAKNVVEAVGGAIANGAAFVKNAVSFIGKIIGSIADFDPAEILESFFSTIKGLTEFFFTDMGALPLFFETGKKILSDFGDGMLQSKNKILETMSNVITNLIQIINYNMPEFLNQGIAFVFELVNGIISKIPDIIDAGLKIVAALLIGIALGIPDLLLTAVSAIDGIFDTIVNNLPTILSAALQIIVALVTGIIANIPLLIPAIIQLVTGIILTVVDMLPEIVEAFVSMIPLIVVGLINSSAALFEAAVTLIVGMIAAIVSLLFNFPELGKAIIDGLIKGIVAAGSMLWDNIKKVFNFIIDGFKALFGIHSPSTVFEGLGGNIISGLINGILGAGANLWNAVSGVFVNFATSVGNFLSNVWNNVTSTVSNIGSAVSNAASGAWDTVTNVVSTVGSAVGGVVSTVGNAIGGAISTVGGWIGGLFGFASGSPFIEQDQIAQIHKGERIVPADFNSALMSGETMMLSPDALSSIIAGVQGFMGGSGFMGQRNVAAAASTVKIVAKMDGSIELDGRSIGRAAFEYADEMVGNAYGT